MFEIDETFRSFDEWMAWAGEHPQIFQKSIADGFAAEMIRDGFIQPITHAAIRPDQLDASHDNWREGLTAHGVISRSRAVLALIERALQGRHAHGFRIFATEAITPFALFLRGIFPHFYGAEFARDAAEAEALFPIPHQDLMALNLPNGRFDLATTNEVLEHVPDIDAALREIARILKPGGWHIGTFPFAFMNPTGDQRAKIIDGALLYLKEPQYHGNPMDPGGGSLVFETPAWDILERARAAGFSDASMRFVASKKYGILTEHLGVFVFCARV